MSDTINKLFDDVKLLEKVLHDSTEAIENYDTTVETVDNVLKALERPLDKEESLKVIKILFPFDEINKLYTLSSSTTVFNNQQIISSLTIDKGNKDIISITFNLLLHCANCLFNVIKLYDKAIQEQFAQYQRNNELINRKEDKYQLLLSSLFASLLNIYHPDQQCDVNVNSIDDISTLINTPLKTNNKISIDEITRLRDIIITLRDIILNKLQNFNVNDIC